MVHFRKEFDHTLIIPVDEIARIPVGAIIREGGEAVDEIFAPAVIAIKSVPLATVPVVGKADMQQALMVRDAPKWLEPDQVHVRQPCLCRPNASLRTTGPPNLILTMVLDDVDVAGAHSSDSPHGHHRSLFFEDHSPAPAIIVSLSVIPAVGAKAPARTLGENFA